MYLTLTLRKPGWRTDQTSPDKTYLMLYIYLPEVYIYTCIYTYILKPYLKQKMAWKTYTPSECQKAKLGVEKVQKTAPPAWAVMLVKACSGSLQPQTETSSALLLTISTKSSVSFGVAIRVDGGLQSRSSQRQSGHKFMINAFWLIG